MAPDPFAHLGPNHRNFHIYGFAARINFPAGMLIHIIVKIDELQAIMKISAGNSDKKKEQPFLLPQLT